MATFDDTALQTHHEMMEVALAESREGWIPNTSLLWEKRRTLATVLLYSLLLSRIIAFSIPKQYESVTRMMPPDQQGMGAAMLAALAGKAMPGGALGALGGGLVW